MLPLTPSLQKVVQLLILVFASIITETHGSTFFLEPKSSKFVASAKIEQQLGNQSSSKFESEFPYPLINQYSNSTTQLPYNESPSRNSSVFRNAASSRNKETQSSIRGIGETAFEAPTVAGKNTFVSERRKEDKQLFRIGLIVPRTAFLSKYKTYTQRIKDTFSHLLHKPQKSIRTQLAGGGSISQGSLSGGAIGGASVSGSSAASAQSSSLYNKPSKCLLDTSPLSQLQLQHQQQLQHPPLPWPDLTFNHFFDIKVVDLVNLAPRSSAQDIIESMCQRLIEQNVSVIVYLENNEDQTVTSLDSHSSSHLEIINSVADSRGESGGEFEPTSSPKSRKTLSKNMAITRNGQISRHANSEANSSSSSGGGGGDNDSLVEPLLRDSNRVRQASSQAHYIMHLAHSAGIPMIAWSVTATLAQRPKKQRTLHLAPTVAHEAEAMLAIMERYSWYSFSVVSTTLAGHDDFILALRQFMVAPNSVLPSSSRVPSAQQTATEFSPTSASEATAKFRSSSMESEMPTQPSKTFKLLDVITLKKQTLSHIEEEIRQLTVSESRVILLYASKGEAIDILKVAKKLKLTKRSYAWIVAQSVIGPNENELAPLEFHPGLLGIYFRSNHERLLDELSRAITIIAHGLERFVRDKGVISGNSSTSTGDLSIQPSVSNKEQSAATLANVSFLSIKEHRQKLLSAHSSCHELPERGPSAAERGDLLYEYFRRSSPSIVFDAHGSLRDVMLNVVNLDSDRQWRRIGCFSNAKLTIDDITWPEQAERPPSGTMEKFHLRAVFLEEPSFVNLADPDTETGECKANRAVRCRYKVAQAPLKSNNSGAQTVGGENHTKELDYGGHSASGAATPTAAATATGQEQLSQNASLQSSFLSYSSNNGEFEYKCCSGFCIDLMEKLATELKFSYDLYRVPDGLWGILENNTWNGLISEITKGRADVIVSSTKINSNRQKAVDFTVPFLDTGISILVAKQTGVISKLAFLEPFDTLAWIMFICVGIPLAATSIFYFEWLSPSGFYAKNKHRPSGGRSLIVRGSTTATTTVGGRGGDQNSQMVCRHRSRHLAEEHHKFSFCRTLWLVITILFGSAAHIDSPKGYTARFMSNVWATFAVVFLAVYTANLAAFMITREEYLEFSGITDSRLAYPYYRHPPLRFGTITGGNTHAVLSANKPNLYNYMRRFNRPTVEDGVDAVKAGQLDAFVYDALVLDYMASQDPECKLINVGSWYSMTGYALAFPKNSRYYDKFNMKMLEYRKNGELDRLRRFWLQHLCKPGQNRHSISKPLDLSQFMSAFLLLGAGILCSVVILLLEHFYIIYVRDRLIKSRHRRKLIECLYPFSLSLADTLRLPGDDEELDECDEHYFESSSRQTTVFEQACDSEFSPQLSAPLSLPPPPAVETKARLGLVIGRANKRKAHTGATMTTSAASALEMNSLDCSRREQSSLAQAEARKLGSTNQERGATKKKQECSQGFADATMAINSLVRTAARDEQKNRMPVNLLKIQRLLDTLEACEDSIESAGCGDKRKRGNSTLNLVYQDTCCSGGHNDDGLKQVKLLTCQLRRELQDLLATATAGDSFLPDIASPDASKQLSCSALPCPSAARLTHHCALKFMRHKKLNRPPNCPNCHNDDRKNLNRKYTQLGLKCIKDPQVPMNDCTRKWDSGQQDHYACHSCRLKVARLAYVCRRRTNSCTQLEGCSTTSYLNQDEVSTTLTAYHNDTVVKFCPTLQGTGQQRLCISTDHFEQLKHSKGSQEELPSIRCANSTKCHEFQRPSETVSQATLNSRIVEFWPTTTTTPTPTTSSRIFHTNNRASSNKQPNYVQLTRSAHQKAKQDDSDDGDLSVKSLRTE